ncbi:MAG: zf-HC2 domain-containing protein [Phycisphaerales bacterium]|nr:zf-HC2 domain-containing protein [Phycisphaerales bacterium]
MNCQETTEHLAALIDGELEAPTLRDVEAHLAGCAACRGDLDSTRALVSAIADPAAVAAPPQVWTVIRNRLDHESGGGFNAARWNEVPGVEHPHPQVESSRGFTRRQWGVFAAAAGLVFMLGVGAFLMRGEAQAAGIDFRPILEQADGDIEAGIAALIAAHGGRAITLEEAQRLMTVRIHPPAKLPAEMTLKGMYLLKMGEKHRSLAFHLAGPRGHLLLLQCPAGVRRDYGNQECLPCKLGAGSDHALRVGALRLMHRDSANVCMCIVSTLDEQSDLPAVLDAIPVDY